MGGKFAFLGKEMYPPFNPRVLVGEGSNRFPVLLLVMGRAGWPRTSPGEFYIPSVPRNMPSSSWSPRQGPAARFGRAVRCNIPRAGALLAGRIYSRTRPD